MTYYMTISKQHLKKRNPNGGVNSAGLNTFSSTVGEHQSARQRKKELNEMIGEKEIVREKEHKKKNNFAEPCVQKGDKDTVGKTVYDGVVGIVDTLFDIFGFTSHTPDPKSRDRDRDPEAEYDRNRKYETEHGMERHK
jgi:hypothetical protein